MLTYATDAELGAHTTTIPDDVEVYLRAASGLVRKATRHDIYDVDPAGKPTEPEVIDAFRDATCIHAAQWIANGIHPGKGVAGLEPQAPETSILGATVKLDLGTQNAAALASLHTLVPEAVAELRNANLATSAVSS